MEAAKTEEEEWRHPAGDEDIGRPKMELEDGGSGRRMRNGRREVGGRRRMWRGRRTTGMHTTGWIRMWMWRRRRRKRCGSRGGIGAGGGVPGGGGTAASGGRGGGGSGGGVARQSLRTSHRRRNTADKPLGEPRGINAGDAPGSLPQKVVWKQLRPDSPWTFKASHTKFFGHCDLRLSKPR